MAQRLLVIAHGLTKRAGELVFGEAGDLLPDAVPALNGRVAAWVSGPEQACLATVTHLGGRAEPIPELCNCDFGEWTDKTLGLVAAEDPAGLDSWLKDPDAAPHTGESLVEVIKRVGCVMDDYPWPDGRTVVVVTSLVARAMITYGLSANPDVIFHIDVGPLGRASFSRSFSTWRLGRLDPGGPVGTASGSWW
jgi:broad specificity phosphatase PhoE